VGLHFGRKRGGRRWGRRPEERIRAGHGTPAPEGPVERPLTEGHKVHEAKVGEREILHRDALRKPRSVEEIAKLNEELAQDGERLARDRDRKTAEIRDRSL
jgi:hypothetical protein